MFSLVLEAEGQFESSTKLGAGSEHQKQG